MTSKISLSESFNRALFEQVTSGTRSHLATNWVIDLPVVLCLSVSYSGVTVTLRTPLGRC